MLNFNEAQSKKILDYQVILELPEMSGHFASPPRRSRGAAFIPCRMASLAQMP
jgi:hypothetical protein